MENQKTIIKQVGGYCVVQRSVSQGLRKHTQALGLYIFLLSLPDGWEFRKNWLKNETGLGINKLNRLLSFLEYHNLIKTTQKKIKGKFAEFEMEVYDGKDFKLKELEPLFESPYHRFRDTETVATEMEHKILDTKKEDKEEIKTYCSSGDERTRSFDLFWEKYPKKVGKKKAFKTWVKNKLYEKSDTIISDIDNRKAKNWLNKQKEYIPNPTTYLNGEGWNDELFTANGVSNNGSRRETASEKCSRLLFADMEEQLHRENQQRRSFNAGELGFNAIS